MFRGINKEAEMQDQLEISKVNDLIFDIGMYKGEDTDFYLKRGFRVIAFEANPDMIALLRATFRSFSSEWKIDHSWWRNNRIKRSYSRTRNC